MNLVNNNKKIKIFFFSFNRVNFIFFYICVITFIIDLNFVIQLRFWTMLSC